MPADPRESSRTAVTPDMYGRVFEGHAEGALVLEDLIRRFGGRLFVKGGEEGRRQTDFNLGRRDVLDFVVGMVNASRGVPPPDEDNTDSPAA